MFYYHPPVFDSGGGLTRKYVMDTLAHMMTHTDLLLSGVGRRFRGLSARPSRFRIAAWGLFFCLLFPSLASQALGAEFYGISRPSSEAALSFTLAGRVTKVLIVDGDFVEPGSLLAEQDGSVLDARMEQFRLESESRVEIEASEAELAQREQDLKKIRQAHEKGAATDLERERAQLEVVISRYRVKAAEEKRDMAVLKLKEAEAERKQYYLASSVRGRIEKLHLVEGESPRQMEPVLTVVNCDPLWIEVPLPLAEADKLSPEDEVTVKFPNGSIGKANVLFISSIADAASETLTVRLAMPNPEWRRAGERVGIVLPGSL